MPAPPGANVLAEDTPRKQVLSLLPPRAQAIRTLEYRAKVGKKLTLKIKIGVKDLTHLPYNLSGTSFVKGFNKLLKITKNQQISTANMYPKANSKAANNLLCVCARTKE